MTGRRSAFVLTAMLGAQGSLIGAAIADPVAPAAPPFVVADDQQAPAPDTSLRKRAEDLARAASEAFTEIMAGGRKQKEQVAQGAPPKPPGDPNDTGAIDGAFAPVWGWLARSAKDYQNVIVAKLKNPSGEVVILAPQGAVVAQQDAAPALPEKKPSELPERRPTEPRTGWSWDGVVETTRDWLARANRSYRNEIVKKLVRPAQPAPDAVTQWPPAEVVPQAPAPADIAAEAEAEQHAAEVRRAAEEAESQRRRDAEAQKQAEEDKRRQQVEAQKAADAADATRKADETKRIADEADAKRKADEAKRVADEAEAKRKAAEQRLAEQAEVKRKADAEAKRVADEAEVKRKADADAKRVAEEAETKRKAEEKRVADAAEAKRSADAEAKRIADAAQTKRIADAETARRLKEESDTERKAVAESEATRLATEAGAKRAAAAGLKPAHENSSVAVARPRPPPAKAPASAEQERNARKEVFVAEPIPPKIVKKKRRLAANYDVRPKKGKRGQLAAHKHVHEHSYVLVEERRPKRFVHAYRQKSHDAPPIPVRNKVRKAPACACPRAYRAPKLHHVRPYAAWHGPRVTWRSCGGDSHVEAAPSTHHRKSRNPNLIFRHPRLYISPERR
jgi:hypothetical protein